MRTAGRYEHDGRRKGEHPVISQLLAHLLPYRLTLPALHPTPYQSADASSSPPAAVLAGQVLCGVSGLASSFVSRLEHLEALTLQRRASTAQRRLYQQVNGGHDGCSSCHSPARPAPLAC